MSVDDTLLANLLQTNDSGLKLSIYQPTHPASTGQTVQEDIIRFKNALRAIRSSDAYDEADLSETMNSLDDLAKDVEFWSHQTLGLAVFANQQGYQVLHLNYDVSEAHYISSQYRVSPLILMNSLGSNYYILDINYARPRLLEGSPAGCTELIIGGMPGSFESMTENVEYKKELQHQSGGVGAFHGHTDEAALHEDALRYYRKIAEAADNYLEGRKDPLVLVGVQSRVGPVCKYLSYSHILDKHVEGNGEAMNEQTLYEQVAPIMERYNEKRRSDLVNEFNESPPERAAVGVEDANTAAVEGRAATLLLPCFRRTVDTVRDLPGESIVLQLVDGDAISELLVRAVLAQGGEVVAVAVDAFGDDQPRVLCRF